jgi:hypothetical protein
VSVLIKTEEHRIAKDLHNCYRRTNIRAGRRSRGPGAPPRHYQKTVSAHPKSRSTHLQPHRHSRTTLSDLLTLFVHVHRGEIVIVARTRQLHLQTAQEPQKLLVGALFARPHFEVDLLDEPIVEQNYVPVPVQSLLEDAASVSGRLRDLRLFENRSFSAYLELEE